jgi:hypothetical protein
MILPVIGVVLSPPPLMTNATRPPRRMIEFSINSLGVDMGQWP